MTSKRRIHLVRLLALFSLLLVSILVYYRGLENRWSSGRRLNLGGGDTLDMWFTPDGRLIRIRQSDSNVIVESWTAAQIRDGQIENSLRTSVDLGGEVGNLNIVPRFSRGTVLTSGAGQVVPYAVSESGTLMGWFWKGNLHTKAIALGVSRQPANVNNSFSVGYGRLSSFTFIDNDRVVIWGEGKYGTDVFQGWKLTGKGEPSRWSIPAQGDWTIWSRGSRIAASSFITGDVLHFSGDNWSRIDMHLASVEPNVGSVLSISQAGDAFVGTIRGEVQMLGSPDSLVALRAVSQPIRALDFFGTYLAVAGDFPGVQFIDQSGYAQEVLDGPSGIRAMAAKTPYIAYATADSTRLAIVTKFKRLNEAGTLYLTVFSIWISLLALFHALLVDQATTSAASPQAKIAPEAYDKEPL